MSEATSTLRQSTLDLTNGWVPGDSWGNRLAQVRQMMKWNYSEAADATGLSRQSWQNWEDGSSPRNLEAAAAAIAAATGVSFAWLLTGQVPPGVEVRTGSFATPLTVVEGTGAPENRTPRRGRLSVVR